MAKKKVDTKVNLSEYVDRSGEGDTPHEILERQIFTPPPPLPSPCIKCYKMFDKGKHILCGIEGCPGKDSLE